MIVGVTLLEAMRSRRGACGPATRIGDTGIVSVNNLFVELYAFRNDAGIVLVDTGLDPAGAPIDALCAALDGTRDEVAHVLLTHAHPDHIAGVPLLPKARIWLGAADVPRLEQRFEGKKPLERAYDRLWPTPAAAATDLIDAELELDVGEPVIALPIPGDTPGALAYLARGVLFVGDACDLKDNQLRPANEAAVDDPIENLRSLAELPARLGERGPRVVCTAHGGRSGMGLGRFLLDELAAAIRATRGS